jgi:F-type H+-transporting ATPase subunit epsilon
MPIPETITCQIVRPDRLLYEGQVESLVLVARTGEIGVWPGHASEIVALGDGIVRLHLAPKGSGVTKKVVVSGGYAEITSGLVVILADHARDIDDIEADVVMRTREQAVAHRDSLVPTDHRRAYYNNKIAWCDLLLRQVGIDVSTDAPQVGAPVAHAEEPSGGRAQ